MRTSRGRALPRTPLGTPQTPRDAQRREGSDVTGVTRFQVGFLTRGGEQPRRHVESTGAISVYGKCDTRSRGMGAVANT